MSWWMRLPLFRSAYRAGEIAGHRAGVAAVYRSSTPIIESAIALGRSMEANDRLIAELRVPDQPGVPE